MMPQARLRGTMGSMDDHARDHHHSELGEMDLRVRALETVLAAQGVIDPAALDVLIDTYQTKIGPRNGARVVARAWSDAAFRDWLRRDATAAIALADFCKNSRRPKVRLVFTRPRLVQHGAASPCG